MTSLGAKEEQLRTALEDHDAESLIQVLREVQWNGASPLMLSERRAKDPIVEVIASQSPTLLEGLLKNFPVKLHLTQTEQEFSALHVVCERGHANLLRVLLENRPDINLDLLIPMKSAQNSPRCSTQSPLQVAFQQWTRRNRPLDARRSYRKCCELLLKHGALPSVSLLLMACRRQSLDAVALLLLTSNVSVNDVEPLNGRTALYTAVWTNSLPLVKFLVQQGADPNVKDRRGNTPLHEYVIQQSCQTESLARENAMAARTRAGYRQTNSVLEYLLQSSGARLDMTNDAGETALALACRQTTTHPRTVELLLQYGANPNASGCLRNAIVYAPIQVLSLLFRYGVDLQAKEQDGRTALHHATARVVADSAVPLLLQHAQLSAEAAEGCSKTKRYMKEFLEAKSNVGRTALHEAAAFSNGSLDMKALLHAGARVNTADREKRWTPLHYACFFGHEDSVRLLLASGAKVNARDKQGRTPLAVSGKKRMSLGCRMVSDLESVATDEGDIGMSRVLSILLQNGADVLSPDRDGTIPALQLADAPLSHIFELVRASTLAGWIR